jgi:hypothetical protein
MLDSDTRIMTSPLTERYRWHMQLQFPFLAYTYLLQRLKKQPADDDQADRAWDAMSDNYAARGMGKEKHIHAPFFVIFCRMVLLAWEAREVAAAAAAASRDGGTRALEVPPMVADIRSKMPALPGWRRAGDHLGDGGGGGGGLSGNVVDTPASGIMHMDFGSRTAPGGFLLSFAAPGMPANSYSDMAGSAMLDGVDMDQLWPTMDWSAMEQGP